MSIDHIVCAVDGSDYASRAVAHAAQLAAALRAPPPPAIAGSDGTHHDKP